MNKKTFRIDALKKREEISPQRKKEASNNALNFLITSCKDINKPILSFASTSLEIDLWPFNEWLLKEKKLLLPKVEKDALLIYEVHSLTSLQDSYSRLKEPNPSLCKKIPYHEIGLSLIPGIAFDLQRNRLGYGKGHFDRFLSHNNFFETWGIGFLEQGVSLLPKEDHDIALNEVFLF